MGILTAMSHMPAQWQTCLTKKLKSCAYTRHGLQQQMPLMSRTCYLCYGHNEGLMFFTPVYFWGQYSDSVFWKNKKRAQWTRSEKHDRLDERSEERSSSPSHFSVPIQCAPLLFFEATNPACPTKHSDSVAPATSEENYRLLWNAICALLILRAPKTTAWSCSMTTS